MAETFRAKPFKVGNSVVLTIPALFIREGRIDTEKEYQVTIE